MIRRGLQNLQIAGAFVLQVIYVVSVYAGWWKSPSLSVLDDSPWNYRPRISAVCVEWQKIDS